MNILFTINHSYVKQIMLVMRSISINNHGKHTFWFIYKELSRPEQEKIGNYAKTYCDDSEVNFIEFDRKELRDLPLHGKSWSIEIFFRLFAPYLLPIDKVLYLDGDVVVNGNLEKLYNTPFEQDKYFCCVANDIMDCHNDRLRLPKTNIYINSGILLMNLRDLRRIPEEEIVFCLIKNRDRFKFPDQDYINCIFKDNKQIVDNSFNYMISVAEINPNYQKSSDIRICHYVMEKPWNIKFPYKTDWLYFKYLAKDGKWYMIPYLWLMHRMYRLYQLLCVPKKYRRI